jgi:hypothetical protein
MNKLLRACAVLLSCAALAFAVDWKALKPEGYVSDFAHVIDAPSKTALEQYCANVERVTGVQMALVTIATLESEPIEDVANTIERRRRKGPRDDALAHKFDDPGRVDETLLRREPREIRVAADITERARIDLHA